LHRPAFRRFPRSTETDDTKLAGFLRLLSQGTAIAIDRVPNLITLEIAMKMQRHFEIENEAAVRELAQIRTMIADFDRTVEILDCEISTEEERGWVSDPTDVVYPILARAMRIRRDNLKVTIGLLDQRLDQISAALPEAIATAA
jgi:hypothetical protein